MPDASELRPVTGGQYRAIWEASAEAFRDHWGENEWTEADWRHFEADPRNDDPPSGASHGTATRWPGRS